MTKETTLSQLLERFKKARDTFLNKIDGMEFYENEEEMVSLFNAPAASRCTIDWLWRHY